MRRVSPYFDYKINGKDYKIRYKTPTVGEQITIGQNYAALKAGFSSLDDISDTLAFATATLSVVIENRPEDLTFETLDADDWGTLRKMLVDYQQFAFFRSKTPEGSSQA